MPRIEDNGQVTLERELREAIGIAPGDEVELNIARPGDVVQRPAILVTPRRQSIGRFRGLLGGNENTDEIMRELRGS